MLTTRTRLADDLEPHLTSRPMGYVGSGIVDVDEVAHAGRKVCRCPPLGTFTLRQERCASRVTTKLAAIALILAIVEPDLSSPGWDRLATSPTTYVGLSSKQASGQVTSGSARDFDRLGPAVRLAPAGVSDQ